jgi:uncharacterized MAPEG superfamily protein
MHNVYFYLAVSGVLTVLMWIPYILARLFTWGLPTFLHNYPKGFPVDQPEPPLWAERAKRAHLNMVETMPAFIAVVVAAASLNLASTGEAVGHWAMIFFYARIVYWVVYVVGVPYLRTPTYLISWAAILMIGAQVVG